MKKSKGSDKNKGLQTKQKDFRVLSLAERVKCFFVRPSELFGQYERSSSYKGLFFAVAVLTTVLFAVNHILFPNAVNDIIGQMRPEAAQEATSVSPVLTAVTILASILLAFVIIWIVSGIYYILVSAFNRRLLYRQAVCIYSVAFISTLIGEIITSVFNAVADGLLDFKTGPYADVAIGQFNIFHIWSLVLIYIGIKTMTGLPRKKIITVMAIVAAGSILTGMTRAAVAQMF
ncbi:MAG: Yip1 family protein [Bacillota bacterium]|nr:Yip1 family protein [Bacillota bacterium]